ncbi:MAG: hypothetical protein M1339_02430, partial [Bacteroidetes bacterium]|nr:hypothetical protein [Bacteroidota bacterium]
QGNGSLQTSQYGITIPLEMNAPSTVGKYTFTFEGFQVPASERQAMIDGKPFQLGSIVRVKSADGKTQTIIPTNEIIPNEDTRLHTVTTKSGDAFTVTDVHVDNQTKQASIDLAYMPGKNSPDFALLKQAQQGPQDEKQALVIEATIKPFINLVWGGVVIMVIGFIVTWRRRREDLLRESI